MCNIFSKLHEALRVNNIVTVKYTRITKYGPDGKVVEETRVLNDGGEAKTEEEVKKAEEAVEKQMERMDRFFGKINDAFEELF